MSKKPTPGGSNNTWGTELNAFLNEAIGIDVQDYGFATGASAATNTAAIASAVTAAPASGARIYFPPGVFSVVAGDSSLATALTDKEGVYFIGAGCDNYIYASAPAKGTVLKATSGSGVLINWAASSSPLNLRGNGWEGISLDCNSVASTGLRLASHYGFQCPTIGIWNATTTGMVWTTADLSGAEDFQLATFGTVTINVAAAATAKCWTWSSAVAGGGNVALCKVQNVVLYGQNGTLLECGDSDHCSIDIIELNRSGTATGIDLLATNSGSGSGHARYHRFRFTDGPAPIISRATGFAQSAGPNIVGIGQGGNNQPFPTEEPGSILVVENL